MQQSATLLTMLLLVSVQRFLSKFDPIESHAIRKHFAIKSAAKNRLSQQSYTVLWNNVHECCFSLSSFIV